MPRAPWDMTGKVIVVTGGNAGTGLGFCRGIALQRGISKLHRYRDRQRSGRELAARQANPGADPDCAAGKIKLARGAGA
jgi:NAD(P)-dependent dehydrogenase (short-subunit alcohol dehydrogenase family)